MMDYRWSKHTRLIFLFSATILLLFTALDGRELWTQEHRWANIVTNMFYRHDFFHPYLGNSTYYDKPLLSYWLIALFAKLTGTFNVSTLRLPCASAGLLAIGAIYYLGMKLKNTQVGLLAAWLMLTTFYFVFWARTSSADMLNLGGSLLALCWYFAKRDAPSFFNYFIFFLILALTCLCKGLIGAVVPIFAVLIDLCLRRTFKQNWRLDLLAAFLLASFIYLLPFILSGLLKHHYHTNGLYLVYRENILRYIKPFDHVEPFYIYFLYLPIYLLPWTIFFIPALLSLRQRWRSFDTSSRWIVCTLVILFLFFTFSGSRRSYYVLPLVPFAILFIADFLLSSQGFLKKPKMLIANIGITFILFFIGFDVLQPWYYQKFGMVPFVEYVQKEANKRKPWQEWRVILLDSESKITFYLKLQPTILTLHYPNHGTLSPRHLGEIWPILTNKPANTIFITHKSLAPLLAKFFVNYQILELPQDALPPLFQVADVEQPIAYIPKITT